jgi:hypothetical protein
MKVIDLTLTEGARTGRDVLKALKKLWLVEEPKTTNWTEEAPDSYDMGGKPKHSVLDTLKPGAILIRGSQAHHGVSYLTAHPGVSKELYKDFTPAEVEKFIKSGALKILD